MCFRSDRLSDGWLMLCNLSKCHGTVLQLLKPASSSLSLSRIKFSSNSWNCAKTFALGFFQTKLTIPNKREGFFFSIRIKFIDYLNMYDESKHVLYQIKIWSDYISVQVFLKRAFVIRWLRGHNFLLFLPPTYLNEDIFNPEHGQK